MSNSEKFDNYGPPKTRKIISEVKKKHVRSARYYDSELTEYFKIYRKRDLCRNKVNHPCRK